MSKTSRIGRQKGSRSLLVYIEGYRPALVANPSKSLAPWQLIGASKFVELGIPKEFLNDLNSIGVTLLRPSGTRQSVGTHSEPQGDPGPRELLKTPMDGMREHPRERNTKHSWVPCARFEGK